MVAVTEKKEINNVVPNNKNKVNIYNINELKNNLHPSNVENGIK
jgi:hypothetical protein